MTWIYTTKQGDTWDMLALRIYGSEMLSHILLQANPQFMRMFFLPAGLSIIVPDTPKGKTNSPLPPWARR